ncbi:hypothetical protein [Paraferrimonas haliotis]|uniref:Uncharacterized protein n=1 Tax=Paraferrimonas haliotis TaxID=2013866 RepID=A0AA37WX66_9GAMM|nr:hypothetical protein [Paraferrimonas haliotis]GLS84333.1 hypothetical protein GCM10007894_23100 [Paraferrimonas haliotis]
MLTKLLITVIVILLSLFVLKQRKPVEVVDKTADVTALSRKALLKFYATLCLGALIIGSLVFVGWHWYDNQQIMQVTISNPNTGDAQVFLARKGEIGASSMVTIQGQQIRISPLESVRIELAQANDESAN